jgi:AcrR family transcriptional regulator
MDLSGSQRREYIVLTAIDLLHEYGINNISTKEIARRLGMSEGVIFKTFPKKNDILIAILEQFSKFDKDIFQTATEKSDNPIEGLLFILDHILVYYENYPAITSAYDILASVKGVPEIEEKSLEIILNRHGAIGKLVKNAQQMGLIDQSHDSDLLADNILYIFTGSCIKWRLTNYEFSLKDRTLQSITLFLDQLVKKY